MPCPSTGEPLARRCVQRAEHQMPVSEHGWRCRLFPGRGFHPPSPRSGPGKYGASPSQTSGRFPDARDLVDALQLVFDRFLDGDDPFVNRMIALKKAYSDVDLPEPVGPVTRKMPCG